MRKEEKIGRTGRHIVQIIPASNVWAQYRHDSLDPVFVWALIEEYDDSLGEKYREVVGMTYEMGNPTLNEAPFFAGFEGYILQEKK